VADALAVAREGPQREAMLGQLDALVDEGNRQVREVLVDLRPPHLEDFGLARALALELQSREMFAGGMLIALRDDAATGQRWPPEVEYAAFMVAREAVRNALRHAGGRKVEVRLAGDAAVMDLKVVDDGAGGVPLVPARGHLGLQGMRERAQGVGAALTIESAPSGGVRVCWRWRRAA
jgi:signal transduction histidine kinase